MLLASPWAFELLRWAGVAYLLWIGLRMIVSAVRGRAVAEQSVAPGGTVWGGIRQGAATNLLNPKVGAFYVAVLPQFIPADAPAALWGLALAAIHALISAVWLAALLSVARVARRWLQKPTAVRAIDATSGAVITGFAGALAWEGVTRAA